MNLNGIIDFLWLIPSQTSSGLRDTLKPSVLVTFGDIAQAIGTQFSTYLSVVGQVLQQASTVTLANDVDADTVHYVISLREGIMDAWGGILLAYKGTPQGKSDN